MIRVAILGDSHIPGRAKELPEKLIKRVREFMPNRIWFTGDFNTLDVLRRINSLGRLDAVLGNKDFLELPESLKFEFEGVKLLLIHGHQVGVAGNRERLQNFAKYYGCDVIVCGHSHVPDVHKDRAIIINPGSCTGVPYLDSARPPSLILATLGGRNISLRLLLLSGAEILEELYELSV